MDTAPQLPHLLEFYSNNEHWVNRCLTVYKFDNRVKLKLINFLIKKSYSSSLIRKGPISVQFDLALKEFIRNLKK